MSRFGVFCCAQGGCVLPPFREGCTPPLPGKDVSPGNGVPAHWSFAEMYQVDAELELELTFLLCFLGLQFAFVPAPTR